MRLSKNSIIEFEIGLTLSKGSSYSSFKLEDTLPAGLKVVALTDPQKNITITTTSSGS